VLSIESLPTLLAGMAGTAATEPPWPVWSSLRRVCCRVVCPREFEGRVGRGGRVSWSESSHRRRSHRPATAVPCRRAEKRKRRERASESGWAAWPGLAGSGKGRSGPREREERCARAGGPIGPSKKKRGVAGPC
jgi:hypothetical protein